MSHNMSHLHGSGGVSLPRFRAILAHLEYWMLSQPRTGSWTERTATLGLPVHHFVSNYWLLCLTHPVQKPKPPSNLATKSISFPQSDWQDFSWFYIPVNIANAPLLRSSEHISPNSMARLFSTWCAQQALLLRNKVLKLKSTCLFWVNPSLGQ